MDVHYHLTFQLHPPTLQYHFAKHLCLIPIQLHPRLIWPPARRTRERQKDENRTQDNKTLKSEEGFTKQINKLKIRIVLVPQQKERDKKITFIETEPAQDSVHSLTHPPPVQLKILRRKDFVPPRPLGLKLA